jgi:glycosyltransferase involved in cell wall biosynthesis
MYASIEYLLCGLPIVSTRSVGGRETYFDDRYCGIVEDAPDAVAAAVRDAIASQIPPQFVRGETLRRLERDRKAFVTYIDQLQIAAGRSSRGEDSLRRLLAGGWYCWSFLSMGAIARAFGASPAEMNS